MPVKDGDKVKIQYVGTLDDGTEFDNSEKHGQPLEFVVGSGQVITGFDNAVRGMEQDQEKEFTLEPTEAYGDHNPELIRAFPKEALKLDQEPQIGMFLAIHTQDGQQIPVKIVEVSEAEVKLDGNHPLAGQRLTFKIKLLSAEANDQQPAGEAQPEKQ